MSTFWGAFNSSRCKTAMLVISIMVVAGYVYSEATDLSNTTLHSSFIIIIGYWMGRTSKAKENNIERRYIWQK